MFQKEQLKEEIRRLGVKPHDTLLVHASMKAVGEVDGGADTVLDAFIESMQPGLLLFPTHTWNIMSESHPVFDTLSDASCVGILSNLFLKRPGVLRSWHPFLSMGALGAEAEGFIAGEEKCNTPCPRHGCYGKLFDRKGKILFLGCSMNKNTFLHGVEEWNNIPNRLSVKPAAYKTKTPEGRLLDCPIRTHVSPVGDISNHYGKMKAPFLQTGIAAENKIGNAVSVLCDTVKMTDFVSFLLSKNPDLFLDDTPVPNEWIAEWKKADNFPIG